MFLWRSVKERKLRRGNQTAGKIKGENCKADSWQKYMAKSSRSYKRRDYGVWCTKMANIRKRYGG